MQLTPNLKLKKPEGTDNVNIDDFNGNADLLDAAITGKVDKVTGKGLSSEDYTSAEKSKLAGIAAGANNYVHPASHPATMITQDASNRFVTDTEKAAWNAKAGTAAATSSAAGLMSAADKSKLDGVAAGANNYTHPATHAPSVIAQDANNRFVTDAEKATWNAKANTTAATTTTAGLMSGADKAKLDGVAAGANNYTHPASHPPSIIAQDASNRFVTDAEKSTWNAKAGTAAATTSAAGLMSSADKSKLDGIAAGAQVNSVTSVAGRTGAVTLAKADVGLSSVENYGVATQAQAEAGAAANVYMTPQRTMQAINKRITVSNTAPASPRVGDIWIDTSS